MSGGVILADWGFTIQETAGLYCAEVKLPPFTQGKKQLSKIEVDTACRKGYRINKAKIYDTRVNITHWHANMS